MEKVKRIHSKSYKIALLEVIYFFIFMELMLMAAISVHSFIHLSVSQGPTM